MILIIQFVCNCLILSN